MCLVEPLEIRLEEPENLEAEPVEPENLGMPEREKPGLRQDQEPEVNRLRPTMERRAPVQLLRQK